MCARTLNLIQIKKRQVVGMGPGIGDMEKTVLGAPAETHQQKHASTTCIAATLKSLANFQVMLELCELVTVHDAIHTVGVTVM